MQYFRGMSQPAKPTRTSSATAQRHRVRQELAGAAMHLFASQGYEATTVDEIAAAAGVARRTFFRHFRSKEEAIFPDHDDTLVRVGEVLDSAEPHEHPLDTVCRGITEVLRMYAEAPEVSVERYRLTREIPILREREIASVARYERLFTRYLLGHFDESAHHDGDDDPLLAEVAASAVVAAHNHVLRRWLRKWRQGRRGGAARPRLRGDQDHLRHGDRPLLLVPTSVLTSQQGEVIVAVARTDASPAEVMRTIEKALKGA